MSSAPKVIARATFAPSETFIRNFRFYNVDAEVNDVELFHVFVCLEEYIEDYRNWGWLDDSAGFPQLKEACQSAKLHDIEGTYSQVQTLEERYRHCDAHVFVVAQRTFSRIMIDQAIVSNETNAQIENMRKHLVQKEVMTQEQANALTNVEILRNVYKSLGYVDGIVNTLLTQRATWKGWYEFDRIRQAICRRNRRNKSNIARKAHQVNHYLKKN